MSSTAAERQDGGGFLYVPPSDILGVSHDDTATPVVAMSLGADGRPSPGSTVIHLVSAMTMLPHPLWLEPGGVGRFPGSLIMALSRSVVNR